MHITGVENYLLIYLLKAATIKVIGIIFNVNIKLDA